MALRGPLSRLLRIQLRHACQQSRGQSVAVLGAPFSRGQVKPRFYFFIYLCMQSAYPNFFILFFTFVLCWQKRGGVEHGPKVIRDAGLIERLSSLGRWKAGKVRTDEPVPLSYVTEDGCCCCYTKRLRRRDLTSTPPGLSELVTSPQKTDRIDL